MTQFVHNYVAWGNRPSMTLQGYILKTSQYINIKLNFDELENEKFFLFLKKYAYLLNFECILNIQRMAILVL